MKKELLPLNVYIFSLKAEYYIKLCVTVIEEDEGIC